MPKPAAHSTMLALLHEEDIAALKLVSPANITTAFRETCEELSDDDWTVNVGAGDIVQPDGNAVASSYFSISKSPWNAGNETSLETVAVFKMPADIAFGVHRSQATLGQEFALEFVDTDAPLPEVLDLAISSITQAATVLTVDTAIDHGLVPGKSIGIAGCSNPLANYPALVVASILSPRQFTATAGPGGTIPSQTITNPPGAKGSVYFRERLGRANDGVSQIFENATPGSASFYLRSESGDALPSGTVIGNHSISVGTTASVQAIVAPYTYSFGPTTEFRMNPQADRVQMSDVAVDALVQATNRVLRTQVCPNPAKTYRFRIRATNNKALTVLTAKVVSVVKTGTTTGTFTTDRPHGLVTNDPIVYYGNSNVAASAFPNLTAATPVTVIDATTFTAVIGTAATVTGYGGVIAKVQGGNLLSALGVVNNSVVNATLTTLTDGTRQLVLTGAVAWSGLSIGDYVNAEGVTNVSNGATLGVDGAWKVANFVSTALTLVPCTAPFAASLPANFGLTNSAGAVIKRSCLRLSYLRIFPYERLRTEVMPRPVGDFSGAAPFVSQGGTVAVSALPALPAGTNLIGNTAGAAAHDAAVSGNPNRMAGRALTANYAAVQTGDVADLITTLVGALINKPYAIPEQEWSFTGPLTTTSDVVVQTAAGAGLKRFVTMIEATNTGVATNDLIIKDGATVRLQPTFLAGQSRFIPLPTCFPVTANTALNFALLNAGSFRINVLGYTAA
jgi:hypothetical protein